MFEVRTPRQRKLEWGSNQEDSELLAAEGGDIFGH
jgi:hypothetical protein